MVISLQAHILFIVRVHSVGKSPKRFRTIGPFFSSYVHFTDFSAYQRILSKTLQQGISA